MERQFDSLRRVKLVADFYNMLRIHEDDLDHRAPIPGRSNMIPV